MADITSPIMLDSTGQGIITALGQIKDAVTGPSAADVTYDGTTSGLSADDVQEAIDELASEKQDTLTFDASPTDNSSNPVTSDGVYEADKNIYGVMGVNGAKNIDNPIVTITSSHTLEMTSTGYHCKMSGSYTWGNVKLLYKLPANTDIKITAELDYVSGLCGIQISGTDSNTGSPNTLISTIASNITADTTINATFNTGNYAYIMVVLNMSGATASQGEMNLNNYMLKIASDSDDTFQPRAETNYQLTQNKMSYAANGVLGAKNLLKNDQVGTTINSTTFAVNSDGTVTVNCSASVHSSATFNYLRQGALNLKAGKTYRIKAPVNSNIKFDFFGTNVDTPAISDWVSIETWIASEIIFTLNNAYKYYRFNIILISNATASNLVVEPMICLADDTDDTYVPYAQTNYQLTTSKANSSALGTVENGAKASKAYAVGEHFSRFGDFCTVTQPIASGGLLTETTNYVVGDIGSLLYDGFINRGEIASGTNLDSMYGKSGIWYSQSNTVTSPISATYYMIVNFDSAFFTVQFYLHSSNIYCRMYTKAGVNSWSPWLKLNN